MFNKLLSLKVKGSSLYELLEWSGVESSSQFLVLETMILVIIFLQSIYVYGNKHENFNQPHTGFQGGGSSRVDSLLFFYQSHFNFMYPYGRTELQRFVYIRSNVTLHSHSHSQVVRRHGLESYFFWHRLTERLHNLTLERLEMSSNGVHWSCIV